MQTWYISETYSAWNKHVLLFLFHAKSKNLTCRFCLGFQLLYLDIKNHIEKWNIFQLTERNKQSVKKYTREPSYYMKNHRFLEKIQLNVSKFALILLEQNYYRNAFFLSFSYSGNRLIQSLFFLGRSRSRAQSMIRYKLWNLIVQMNCWWLLLYTIFFCLW